MNHNCIIVDGSATSARALRIEGAIATTWRLTAGGEKSGEIAAALLDSLRSDADENKLWKV